MKREDDLKVKCPECLGSKDIYDGEEYITCPECQGSGWKYKVNGDWEEILPEEEEDDIYIL